MSVMVVIQQMIIIFLLIAIGIFLFKRKMLSEMTSRQISGLIVNVTNPALLISSSLQEGPRVPLQELGTVLAVDLVVYGILIAASFLIPYILRAPNKDHYSYQMLTVFGNVGFIGIPLITAVLGTEALIYVSIFNLIFSVLIYTLGISILHKAAMKQAAEREGNSRQDMAAERMAGSPWKKLVNVGTVSAIVAIVIYLGGFRVPEVLASTLNYIGQSTTLLSMLVLGVSVAQMAVRDILTHPKLYGFVLIRQILLPIGCILLLRPFFSNPLVLNTTALLLAVPAGNMPLMLSKQLQVETDTISQGIILTTVLSLVTIPIVSLFL